MNTLDTAAKENGFESQSELLQLVCMVDLSTKENRKAFEFWKLNDGTKEGILKLPGVICH